MQEEVENRAVTLVISATKLTARLLKAVIAQIPRRAARRRSHGKGAWCA